MRVDVDASESEGSESSEGDEDDAEIGRAQHGAGRCDAQRDPFVVRSLGYGSLDDDHRWARVGAPSQMVPFVPSGRGHLRTDSILVSLNPVLR